MTSTSTHRKNDDRGFTLIELMVVVLIIAILLAIAIPTFLGAQNKAKDRSAQSSARNALTNAKTIFADNGDYTDATIGVGGTLTLSEPSLTFVADDVDSTGPKEVSVLSADATTWYAAVMSQTGTCFYIKDTVDLAQSPAGTTYEKEANADTCNAGALVAPLVYAADGWK
jgi:type IV pilus assembly protein PilA